MEKAREAVGAGQDALLYVVRRVQTDAEFRYHMIGTETLDRVIKGLSALSGAAVDQITTLVRENRPQHESRCSMHRAAAGDLELLREETEALVSALDAGMLYVRGLDDVRARLLKLRSEKT